MMKFVKRLSIVIATIAVLAAGIYFLFPGAVIGAAKQAARWNAGVTSKEIVIGDFTWPYLEGGTGDTVLMVHGFGADRDLWGELMPALTKKYRVIAPDLPGFGGNSRVDGADYSVPAQAVRLHAFAEKLGLKEFIVIGQSMGGGIASWYAAVHPERIKGLVLISSMGVRTTVVSDVEKIYLKGETIALFKNAEQYDRTMEMIFFNPPKLPAHFKRHIAGIGAENYEFHRKIADTLVRGGFDLMRTMLPKIRAKTLVVWGQNDRFIDASCADEFRKGIRDCRVVMIPRGGHMVYMERPEETVAALTGFLEELK